MPIKDFQLEVPFTSAEKAKLGTVATNAAALPAQVSGPEKTAGTETAVRSFSPDDIKDMVLAHETGGGGGSVAVDDEGGEVVASVARINFTGAGVTASDAGGGEVTVNIPGGGGSSLLRYQASATAGEEVEVMATGAGVTYARVGTTGTFTVPGGVRLLGARLRLPMGTIGGFSFTVDFNTNGGNDGNTSFANMYPPMAQVWREDTGAQVASTSTIAPSSNFDQIQLTGLQASVTNLVRLQW